MDYHRYFIGTRVEEGRYGPQSPDMSLSDLLGLFRSPTDTTQYVFPDLTPLVRCIHGQIMDAFAAHHEQQRMQNYNTLFNAWARAASYEDKDLRSNDWHMVIDKAEDFLVALQLEQVFPYPKPEKDWDFPLVERIAGAGRLYTEALLFIITARAAREPHTLSRDITLRGYCQWLRDWVKAYLNERDRTRLLLDASLRQPESYPAVRAISPNFIPASPDAFLAAHVRAQKEQPLELWQYRDDFPNILETAATATVRELHALNYKEHHWQMIYTLRDVIHRVERIEAFLTDLEEKGDSVAFDQQGNTTETVQALLRGDYSPLQVLP
ncbi:hypothetical protein C5E18_24715 (plasmid) [Pectobacterium parmentieri]|uniref:hypothetical protein n=1 Tax=Pectobacterium parmentieri TaxID=1905730 RepID=UPI000F8C9269|nr:hypothetical protein [Pectobacterium parmentieri]AZS59321.1 hypothetical protein C5E18_24715 [Pectobacterium parmentieri]